MKKINRNVIKNIFNGVLLLFGILAIITFLAYVQNEASRRMQKQRSEIVLSSVVEALDDNLNKAETLTDRFNRQNQESLTNLAEISKHGIFDSILTDMNAGNYLVACDTFSQFSKTVECDYMYVINSEGLIVAGDSVRDLRQSIESKTSIDGTDPRLYNGTGKVGEDGKITVAPIIIQKTEGKAEYIYTTELHGSDGEVRYLLIGYNDDILKIELSALKDIGRIMGSITVGESGFVFCVDKATGKFLYYNDGVNELTGQDYKAHGVTDEALDDGFFGRVALGGENYYCASRDYESKELGEFTVITAAISEGELLGKNVVVIVASAVVFLIVTIVFFCYSQFLQSDFIHTKKTPETFLLFPGKKALEAENEALKKYKAEEKEAQRREKAGETDVKHPHPVVKAPRLYFNWSIAKRVGVLALVGIFCMLAASIYMQTLLSLQSAVNEAELMIEQVGVLLSENDQIANSITDYYNSQYVSKAQQISALMETNPNDFFNFDLREENVFAYKGENEGVYSLSHSEYLQTICKNNDIDEIFIIDEAGRTIATSTNSWDFVLSTKEGTQSFEFWDILNGKQVDIAQGLMTDERGMESQFFGTLFHYYTTADGKFASKAQYEKDSVNITRHRGVLQIRIEGEHISNILSITSAAYVIEQLVPTQNSSFMVFDSTPEHRVLYSRYPEAIGKAAAEIDMDEICFSSEYNGFRNFENQPYFEVIRMKSNYYCGVYTPESTIYHIRTPLAIVTTVVGFVSFLFMSVLVVFHSQEEEDAYTAVKYDETYKVEYDTITITLPSGKIKKLEMQSEKVANMSIPWRKMKPEQKLGVVVRGIFGVLTAAIVIRLAIEMADPSASTMLPYILFGKWAYGLNFFVISHCLILFLGLSFGITVLDFLITVVSTTLGSTIETMGQFFISLIKYGSIAASVFYGLYLFGIDGTSLIASAGILSLVIGLGAQSLIGDLLAGVFIAIEGEFRVGDVVTIGDFTGQVIEIGLRTTKIKDIFETNDVKIFNNSAVANVVNKTRDLSTAVCYVGIEYDEDINRVEEILTKEFPNMKKRLPMIIEGPKLKGVENLGDSAVVLKIVARCTELNRGQVRRSLNREIWELFQKENINIPFNQIVVSEREPSSVAELKEMAAKAEEDSD